MALEAGHLPVNDRVLYWERYGEDGPLLHFVPGGMGTAYSHELNAKKLSERFRVVTYDRRGYAHTRKAFHPTVEADPSTTIGQNAEDAAALIRHFAHYKDEPAFVYGSCFGAIAVLELVRRYPQLVRLAVVHEPPLPRLVSDAEREFVHATMASVPRLIRESGFEVGSKVMESLVIGAQETQALHKSSNYENLMEGNAVRLTYAYTHDTEAILLYEVDWDEMMKQKAKIVLAKGELSDLPLVRDPVETLAARLGRNVVLTPGGHLPFATDRDRTLAHIESIFDGQSGSKMSSKL